MSFGLVTLEPFLHQVIDHLLVLPAFHVDEIANDQTANIAQPKLTRDFICRLQICLQNCFFDIAPTFVPAGIHINRDQGFSLVNHNIAAAPQPDLPMKSVVDLLLHAVTFENRRCAVIKMNSVPRSPRNLADHFVHPVNRLAIIADDFIDFFSEKVTHSPFNQIGLLKNSARRRTVTNQLLYFRPLIEEEAQIPNKVSCALSFSNSADDDADAFRNVELA